MMPDSAWRSPMPCPKCLAVKGRPCSAQSKTLELVIVAMRCEDCGHEWTTERATPFLPPGQDLPPAPEEPA